MQTMARLLAGKGVQIWSISPDATIAARRGRR